MIKAMLFIDGSWLYANLPELGKIYGKPDFQIDFGKLPTVLAEDIAEQAGMGAIDLVRTYYFASYAENYDVRDIAAVQRRMAFFSRLKEDYNYEVEAFPINYQGRRLRRVDRDPGDEFVPKEKCVDISLAITVMHYATMPSAMDVAILLIGDRDFVPLLQDIRRRGIRVALASIYGSCAQELADPADAARVRDFDIIWLNDVLDKIEYVSDDQAATAGEQQHQQLQREGAAGARRVWTTNVPRWGRRPRWAAYREELLLRIGPEGCAPDAELPQTAGVGEVLRGRIKNIIWDRGFGFIAAEDGPDYFFHANALEAGLAFDELQPDMEVVFEVKTRPTTMRAGAALSVRRTVSVTVTAEGQPAGGPATDAALEGAAAAAAGAMAAGDLAEEDGDEVHPGATRAPAPVPTAGSAAAVDPVRGAGAGTGEVLRGRIKNIIWDRGFGFIAAEDGPDYFFHANGLIGDLTFEALQPGLAVVFEVRTRPTAIRAGAALNVRRDELVGAGAGGEAEAPEEDGETTGDDGESPAGEQGYDAAAAPPADAGGDEAGEAPPPGPGGAVEDDGRGDDPEDDEGPETRRRSPSAAAETLDFPTVNAALDRPR